MEHKQYEFTEAIKTELKNAWRDGRRMAVLNTLMFALDQGEKEIALWIHNTFKYEYTDEEFKLLGQFAAQSVVRNFAEQLANGLRAQSSVNPTQAAKDIIARAMAH